ncbi:uncharacterized protein G2W53_022333 [Senna tora]|uniref:Uncharacterized protein n=1 Tax=Senna tora TaxID=362788 RepID=A0A834TU75_9FABA|nr:uncharacterized protein G2W53_022333 [Senna tora]
MGKSFWHYGLQILTLIQTIDAGIVKRAVLNPLVQFLTSDEKVENYLELQLWEIEET